MTARSNAIANIRSHREVLKMRWLHIFGIAALACATPAQADGPYFAPELGKTYFTCNWNEGEKSHPLVILSDFENGWFTTHLRAAKEPSLYLLSKSKPKAQPQVVRFTWLRSFHPPVIIRVVADQPTQWRLIGKELSGTGGYKPGVIRQSVVRTLTRREAADLQVLLSRAKPFTEEPGDCVIGVDGAEWIIEGVDQSGYHFIKRWSPSDGPVREVGQFLIRLTGWQYQNIY